MDIYDRRNYIEIGSFSNINIVTLLGAGFGSWIAIKGF
jgi:hypothetical protein